MKSIVVGLLAAFALTGCGVGVDELEGEVEATAQVNRQLMDSTGHFVGAQAEMRMNGDPWVALPQDPIPVYEGKTSGPAGPRMPK
jgi:hypothetical protein